MSWWKRWSILDSGLWEITRWGPQVPGLVLWGDRPSTIRVYPLGSLSGKIANLSETL